MIGRYGEGTTLVGYDLAQIEDLATTGIRIAREVSGGGTAQQRAAVLRARLHVAMAEGRSLSYLADLRAKLAAAEHAAAVAREREQASRDVRTLTRVGLAVGVGIGAVVLLRMLAGTLRGS